MKRFIFVISLCILGVSSSPQQMASPEKFLGYPLGSQFTPYFKIVNYFQELAQANSATIKLEKFGETYEGRPLMLAYISSPENLKKLEAIRLNNLRLSGMLTDGTPADEQGPAIVWLSYNVHGNEASSSEAAMKTLFALLSPETDQVKEWLKNIVVIMDPCVNPDGHDRYVNWYNTQKGKAPDPDWEGAEHKEPWPGGRTNHYHFDLNRDWAWQTQIETQERLKKYNQWLPQVHVDYHEQGFNDPYYFAPAAEPYHEVITAWQREFQEIIGKNNAGYFDRHGWLYFTKERFDLFYPSYGDTYPTFNGAIGMTFEQGGGGRAGLAVKIDDGDTLTLSDRLEHHFTTGMSTIEVSSKNATRLIKEYHKYFLNAQAMPGGEFKSYLIKSDGGDNKLEKLKLLLSRNGIRWNPISSGNFSGINYESGKPATVKAEPGDLYINANQPKSNLIRVLFERNAKITDSVTYDITAWSVPFAFGLHTIGLSNYINSAIVSEPSAAISPIQPAYAYAVRWMAMNSAHFLASLLIQGVKVRKVEQSFRSDNQDFGPGTLIIMQAGNTGLSGSLEKILSETSLKTGVSVQPISSGLVEKGYDFGSSRVHFIHPPRVALLSGTGVSAGEAGEVWHLFDQELEYPLTVINEADEKRIILKNYDVLILPDGTNDFLNDKESADNLKNWVRGGGRLIAEENAVSKLADANFGVKLKTNLDPKNEKVKIDSEDFTLLHRYENRERDGLVNDIPGSIYKVELDNSHPLAYGYPGYYFTLKQDDKVYDFLPVGGWNVGIIRGDNLTSGHVGSVAWRKIRNGLLFGVQDMGQGEIVYLADDPLFRSFWENGKLLFCNAIFQVGQ